MDVNAFINQWNGRAVDVDGFPPAQRFQCYDVFIQYVRQLTGNGGFYWQARQTGYAKDIFNGFDGALAQHFDRLPWNVQGQPGDIAVWGESANTQLSHVAILVADNGAVQRIFGQNHPHPYCTVRDLPSTGLLGYLRPKVLSRPQQPSSGGGTTGMITNQDQLNRLYDAVLRRPRGAGEGEDVYLNKDSGWVFNDLYASAERATRLRAEADVQAGLAGQMQQTAAERDAALVSRDEARALLAAAQSDDITQAEVIATKDRELQAATTQLAEARAENERLKASGGAREDGGFNPTPPVLDPNGVQKILQALVAIIKQVLGVK